MKQQHPRILVLGGGVMGLACAWRLAVAGARVEIFEAREPGQGATLAALGALWPASPLAIGPLQQLHRASLWQFGTFIADLSEYTGRPIGFQRLGRLELLNSTKTADRARMEAQAACEQWPAFGAPLPVMELLEPAQIAQRWPHLAPATYPALLCRATAQVHVPQFIQALLVACASAGVIMHLHAHAAVEVTGEHVVGIRTAAILHQADAVVVTTGAWSAQLAPQVAAVAPIRPAKGQGLALQMPHGIRLETIVKSDSIYLIPWDDAGEILVGSTTEPEVGFDETITPDARQTLLEGAARILPGLKDAVVLRQWSGLRPQNPAKRHPPIMGPHPEYPNLFLCTGHFKTGIGLAPLVSQLMAESILGGKLAEPLTPFCPH